ncbi:uncharacterized protein LOC126629979 isoform X2 [Malus sylvestris]|nr:uncharacterized protein LOC126629979 isoform X2 [Malus sylvestris]
MDAAIDATREMGFDEKLVRSTVNDLLKVYKGKNRTLNPWRSIEECCYTLLNEELLEKVKAQDAAGNRTDLHPECLDLTTVGFVAMMWKIQW